MSFDREVDLTGLDPDALDAGSVNVPGWYQCELANIKEDPKVDGCLVFEYRVTEGVFAGGIIYDRLYDPLQAEDTDKALSATKRMSLVGIRLGVLAKSDFGKPGVTIPWLDAVERKCWVHISTQKWNDRKTGEEKSKTGVDWSGIWAIDDERAIKAAAKAAQEEGKDDKDKGPGTNGQAPNPKGPKSRPPAKPAPSKPAPSTSYEDL